MKRILIVCCLLIVLVSVACADVAGVTRLTFEKKNFESGQKLPVYNGPGYEYIRPTGYASVDTDDTVWYAGSQREWTMVMYQKSKGGFRVGWIDNSKLYYRLGGKKIQLSRVGGWITENCQLTDDPKNQSYILADLGSGTSVTVLATLYDHIEWAYIEVYGKQPLCGFVPAYCVSTGSQVLK